MSSGQMLLTHFIIVVVYIGQMLLCQSILFFISWFLMLKNLVGIRVSPALMLLGYDQLLIKVGLFPLPTITGSIPTVNLYSN